MVFGNRNRAWISEDLLSCACFLARIAISALLVFSITFWLLEAIYYWYAHVVTEPDNAFLIPLQYGRAISGFLLFFAYLFSFVFRGRHRYGALLVAVLPWFEYAFDVLAIAPVCRQLGVGTVERTMHYLPMLFYRAPYYFYYCFWSRIVLAVTAALVLALFVFIKPIEVSFSEPWATWPAIKGKLLGVLRHGTAWGVGALAVFYSLLVYSFDAWTSGSLHFSLGGVFSEVAEYKKGETRVVVVPMIHIGDRNFYQEVLHKYDPFEGVTLLEGISGDEKILKGISHRSLASLTGVMAQVDEQFRGCSDEIDVCGGDRIRRCNGKMTYVNADMATSQLREPTRQYLLEIAKLADSAGGAVRAELLLNRMGMLVRDDLFAKREGRLFQEFDRQKVTANLIVIPWGAGHSFNIRKTLENQGYAKIKDESIRVFGPLTVIRLFYLGLCERL